MATINASLETSLKQHLILNQNTRVWLDIISMPAYDLVEKIKHELDNNPFIIPNYKSGLMSSGNSELLESVIPNSKESIFSHLETQINIEFSNKKDIDTALNILGFLNKDGFILTPLEEISKTLAVSLSEVKRIVSVIKKLDPLGIASSSLKECLYTQLESMKETDVVTLAKVMVEKYLNELSKKNYSKISDALNINIEDIEKALKLIQTLEPYPARNYDTTPVKYVVPELFILKKNDEWVVKTNKDFIEPLQISKKYIKLMGYTKDKKTLEYLREKLVYAKSLINAIEERRKTLHNVGLALLELQYDFFEQGVEYLKPLTLKDIAYHEKVSLSESTISRISNNKYLETTWGTFSIKYFFSSVVSGNYSARSVKEIVKRIIESSNVNMSDEKIRLILKSEGIDLSRRTVTKYRNSMNIFSSRDR